MSGALRAAAVDARIEQFDDGTPTARDAAKAVGVRARADREVGRVRLRRPVRPRARPGRPARRRAGRRRGGRCVGRPGGDPGRGRAGDGLRAGRRGAVPAARGGRDRCIDRSFLAHSVVWIGAGTPYHMASLPPADLPRLAAARTVDLGRPAKLRSPRPRQRSASGAGDREDLDERRARRLGRREGPRRRRTRCTTGSGVFEGIRLLRHADGARRCSACGDHFQRLHNSAHLLYMQIPYSVERADGRVQRPARAPTRCPSATSGRSRSTATASSASRRATIRSRSRS